MTHEQMLKRYKTIKKNNYSLKITCPVCNKEICEGDEGIEYSKTKRQSEIFIHRSCVMNWGVLIMQLVVIISFSLGALAGIFLGILMISLCKTSSESERCADCFGASMNDCGQCPYQEGGEEDDKN